MAIQLSANAQISGQVATPSTSYCYLYEPLKVIITEATGLTATKYYIELEVRDTSDYSNIIETISQYGVFDVNAGEGITVDLMKMARQHHNANIYKFASMNDVVGINGWKSVVSEYIYNFNITSDVSTTVDVVSKLPIIGGRPFDEFVPTVLETQNVTEAEIQGVSFSNIWSGWPYILTSLADPTDNDARPTMIKALAGSLSTDIKPKQPCGGYLVWKSKYGGWMQWGFDLGTESTTKSYQGNLQVGMFESTNYVSGNPYVQVDYTGIKSGKSRTMKALGLTTQQLRAVSGIADSTAVYYVKSESGEMELVRLTSSSVPLISSASGGTFSVSIKSISQLTQQTR
jgi:hypothetical protein